MDKIQRWDFKSPWFPLPQEGIEDDNGPYVLYSDVEKLEAQNKELRERVKGLEDTLEKVAACLHAPGDCPPPDENEKWEVRNAKMIVRRMVQLEDEIENTKRMAEAAYAKYRILKESLNPEKTEAYLQNLKIAMLEKENTELRESLKFIKRELSLSDAHGGHSDNKVAALKAELEKVRSELAGFRSMLPMKGGPA